MTNHMTDLSNESFDQHARGRTYSGFVLKIVKFQIKSAIVLQLAVQKQTCPTEPRDALNTVIAHRNAYYSLTSTNERERSATLKR